jgi:hypothetical protein
LDFHASSMPYIWTIIVDVAIFLILYKYRVGWMILHVFMGLAIALITLISALPVVAQTGVLPQ